MSSWIRIAQSQLGVQEFPKGSNAGKQVEIYLKSVGLGKGYAWCMAFVYWCVQQAFSAKGLTPPLKRTGGVRDQHIFSKKWAVKAPQPGDIFMMIYSNGSGHTGFVEKLLPGGYIQTLEGNTNDEGSREGYMVCRRVRAISTVNVFIRLEEPL